MSDLIQITTSTKKDEIKLTCTCGKVFSVDYCLTLRESQPSKFQPGAKKECEETYECKHDQGKQGPYCNACGLHQAQWSVVRCVLKRQPPPAPEKCAGCEKGLGYLCNHKKDWNDCANCGCQPQTHPLPSCKTHIPKPADSVKCKHDSLKRYCGKEVFCELCKRDISTELCDKPPHAGPCEKDAIIRKIAMIKALLEELEELARDTK